MQRAESPAAVLNFFDTCWVDGHGPVFTGTFEERRTVEGVLHAVPESKESALLVMHPVEVEGRARTVAVLRFDAMVDATRRFHTYLHALLTPRDALTLNGWRTLVHAHYGSDLEDRLDALIQRFAGTTPAAAQPVLDTLAFSEEDLAALAPTRDTPVDAVGGTPPPKPVRRVSQTIAAVSQLGPTPPNNRTEASPVASSTTGTVDRPRSAGSWLAGIVVGMVLGAALGAGGHAIWTLDARVSRMESQVDQLRGAARRDHREGAPTPVRRSVAWPPWPTPSDDAEATP